MEGNIVDEWSKENMKRKMGEGEVKAEKRKEGGKGGWEMGKGEGRAGE